MGLKKLGMLAAGLTVWYALNGTPKNYERERNRYPLPQEIEVKNCSYHRNNSKGTHDEIIYGNPTSKKLDMIIKTEEIDFHKDFVIETDRYRLVKDKDWLPSRLIGHTLSMPGKLLFWNWDYALGQDEERAKATLSMLEKDKTVKDITLRLNHNEAFYDMWRMFTDKKLRERNNFFARVLIGIPVTMFDEIWAEFSRGSYYNPLTGTVVCYSNIESVTAHELGHHKDFQRFSSDWEYELFRFLPPVMLYQEWKASTIARDNLMIKEDRWQFNRYLIPAFATYVLASMAIIRKWLKKIDED